MDESISFRCVLCFSAFEFAPKMRSHYSRDHRVNVHESIAYWPEFHDKPERFVRLCWFRWARLEGWAFAMDEVTA